ncbi:putative universal stress protein [bacterium BMS3Abin04]|nr:putative universal stress protein [bacterium BMS3Abin04]
MFTKILFPTDFSEAAEKAKDKLVEMSKCNIGEIILLHVVDIRIFSYSTMLDIIEVDNWKKDGKLIKELNRKLDAWKDELEKAGLKVSTEIKEGIPFDEILKYSENNGVTLILLPSVGHGVVERMLVGSTAEKVLRKSKVSVILLR